jgi:hypothetical protein
MKQIIKFAFDRDLYTDEWFANQAYTQFFGIPQSIELTMHPIDDQGPDIARAFSMANEPNIKYHGGRIITLIPSGQVETTFVASSEPVGATCYMNYRFADDFKIIMDEESCGAFELFSQKMDKANSEEEIYSFHFWAMSIVVGKLKELKYFAHCHDDAELEFIAATEA